MTELRVQWEADYSPGGSKQSRTRGLRGNRGTAVRRRSAITIARTRKSDVGRGITGLNGLLRSTKPVIPKTIVAAEKATLNAILNSRSPEWPVETGFSLANFGFIGTNEQRTLTNRAPYADRVNRYQGRRKRPTPILETIINKAQNDIIEASDKAAQEGLDNG